MVGSSILARVPVALALMCGLAAGSASAQSFSGLGFLPGGTESVGLGVSNNGVVTGFAFAPTGFRAFQWTEVDGMVDLGTLPVTAARRGANATRQHLAGARRVGLLIRLGRRVCGGGKRHSRRSMTSWSGAHTCPVPW
jgi:probable HAF family extracellular repeat protein